MSAMRRGPWNHNVQYHDVILRAVPRQCRRALDVGCGQGLLAQHLSAVATNSHGCSS